MQNPVEVSRDAGVDQVLAAITAGALPARQQPDWGDERGRMAAVGAQIAGAGGVVDGAAVRELHGLLARAAAGELTLLQVGDCAEDPADCAPDAVTSRVSMLRMLGQIMEIGSGTPVIEVGRMAGQFAKPRSQAVEQVGDVELPVFRGCIVNGPEPTADARRPDPDRVLQCYHAARGAVSALDAMGHGSTAGPLDRVWTSHEALLLDYELPLVRREPGGGAYLSSTHWPWIGERTRQVDGAHVRLLASLDNPLACKVGSTTTAADLVDLCEVLDPGRVPGRLTLIPRFGVGSIDALGPLVAAVRAAGHPAIWLCDPMHGNTVTGPDGIKTRRLPDIMTEIDRFIAVVSAHGGVCGGLHLEATPDDVVECDGAGATARRGAGYTTLCDPRLNVTQAVAASAHWNTRNIGAAS
jgi:3-deoxy-7-phosphoheptulonate synthase